MHAERMILETDDQGRLKMLPPNSRVEAIFLLLEGGSPGTAQRVPPPGLLGSVRILGDITSPAFAEEEWGDLA